jgi:hypothetical protein
MDRYKIIKNGVTGLSIGLGAAASTLARDYAATLNASKPVIYGVLLVSFAIGYFVVKTGLDLGFSSSLATRRVLLGRFYIEDLWLEHVRRNGLPYCIGVVQFTPDDYSFKLQGENYDASGVSMNAFRAELSSLAWPIAQFQHFNSDTRTKKDPFEGLGVVTFEEGRPYPTKYTAHYTHNTSQDNFSSVARRLTEASERALLCQQKTLREFVIREWHQFTNS